MSFKCQLDATCSRPQGKRVSRRDGPDPVGLWQCWWGIILITGNDVASKTQSAMDNTVDLGLRLCKRKLAEHQAGCIPCFPAPDCGCDVTTSPLLLLLRLPRVVGCSLFCELK